MLIAYIWMSRKIFLPENLDLDKYISQYPPNFHPFHIDNLRYLLYLVKAVPTQSRSPLVDGWTTLCAQILVKYVRDYQHYLGYALRTEILQSTGAYTPGERCREYRFTAVYRNSPLKESIVSDPVLLKKLSIISTGDDKMAIAQKEYKYVTSFFKSGDLGINKDKVINELNTTYVKSDPRYQHGIITINNIMEQNWRFSISERTRRFYSTITSLPRKLRQYITYGGQKLVEIDISNCQPFFILGLFNKDFWMSPTSRYDFKFKNVHPLLYKRVRKTDTSIYYKSIIKYINMLAESDGNAYSKRSCDLEKYQNLVVSGDLYEYMMDIYLEHCHIKYQVREEVKKMVMWVMYGNPDDIDIDMDCRNYQINPIALFKQLFPVVHGLLDLLKKIDYRYCSWLLQGMEGFIMLKIIPNRIKKERPDVPIFTVHDSILTTEPNIEYVRNVISEEIEKHVGYRPPLKCNNGVIAPVSALV
ncbi:hypothetical protein [Chitinophaga sp. MM2321]|uniref:hypothetical protein n=1 Tax=Chitinophaga sp. MM2321 TaxID=3137178 RepID=UPI0032D5768D